LFYLSLLFITNIQYFIFFILIYFESSLRHMELSRVLVHIKVQQTRSDIHTHIYIYEKKKKILTFIVYKAVHYIFHFIIHF